MITIRKSKTDQSGKGEKKILYAVDSRPMMCPVRLTKKYLVRLSKHLGEKGENYEGCLQPQVKKCSKLGYQIPLKEKRICYSTCLEESKKLLIKIGAKGRFGEHSGRRGGATTAAANGANLDEVQKLGNLKSSGCANRYIDQNAEKKEQISKLLYPS